MLSELSSKGQPQSVSFSGYRQKVVLTCWERASEEKRVLLVVGRGRHLNNSKGALNWMLKHEVRDITPNNVCETEINVESVRILPVPFPTCIVQQVLFQPFSQPTLSSLSKSQ
jgi:hypothetical protein